MRIINKKLKLISLILILFLCSFLVNIKDTYAIYKQKLSTTIDLTVEDPSTQITYILNSHGGGEFNNITVTYGSQIGTLPTPHIIGYNFLGWFTDVSGGTKVTAETLATSATSPVTLHAQYEKIICKIAPSLHTSGNTSFGIIPNSSTLAAGFAYNCDVNGDGLFDNDNERFYYLTTENDIAVFIYSNNTTATTAAGDAAKIAYNQDKLAYEGPTLAQTGLPNSTWWSNVQLHNLPRQILNGNGGTTSNGHTIVTYDYNGKTSRLPTVQEINTACNNDITTCGFLFENTKKYNEDYRSNYWLENPVANENSIHRIAYNQSAIVKATAEYAGENGYSGIRPAIEIPIMAIEYYSSSPVVKHTITLNAMGGSVTPSSIEYEDGEAIGTLPTPDEREDYVFAGWFYDSTYMSPVNSTDTVTEDDQLYAGWTELYTVTFNANGGTVTPTSKKIAKGSQIGSLPTPDERQNATFLGWYLDNGQYDTLIESNRVINSSENYIAKWDIIEYVTVTFNANGGTVTPTELQVVKGSQLGNIIPEPDDRGREFQFDGWFIDNGLFDTEITSTRTVSTDEDYIAHWTENPNFVAQIGRKKYTTFQDALADVTTSAKTTIKLLTDVELSTTTVPQISSNQNIELDLQSFTLSNNKKTVITNNGTLWIKNGTINGGKPNGNNQQPAIENKTGAVINMSGGEIRSDEGNVVSNDGTFNMTGGTITISPTKDQGVFNNNGAGTLNISGGTITAYMRQAVYNDGGKLYISGTALLENQGTTTVSRSLVQNVANKSGKIYITGGTLIFNATNTNNTAHGAIWNASSSNSLLVIGTNDGVVDTTSPVIISKKQGVRNDGGTFEFYDGIIKAKDSNDGPISNKNTVVIDTANNVAINDTGTETIDEYSFTYRVAYIEQQTLLRTVTFHPENGESTTVEQIQNGTTIGNRIPSVTRNDYALIGWFDDPTDDTNEITSETIVTGGNKDYYAHWRQLDHYEVTYNANTGTCSTSSTTVSEGNPIGSLPTANKTGTMFLGWYTAASGGTKIDENTVFTENKTVYAHYSTEISNKVTFDTIPAAMKNYYTNVNTWMLGQSDTNHSTYDTLMTNNLNNYNCVNFNGDYRINGITGSVFCDQPNKYDTNVNGDLIVYEYDAANNKKGKLASYVTSTDGKIYNMIPGKTYYWEADGDDSINGFVEASTSTSRRRLITIENTDANDTIHQIRNVRDLGGIAVSNEVGTGTIKYGKLYRGEKIWKGNGSSKALFNKLGIDREIDLRESNEPVTSEETKLGTYTLNTIVHYKIEYCLEYDPNDGTTCTSYNTNYTTVRNQLIQIMTEIANGADDFALYFHCRIGADRTGTIAYLLEGLLGASDNERLTDYELSVFFGLDERTRFYEKKESNTTKLTYMKKVLREAGTSGQEDIMAWFLQGSTNETSDRNLVNSFRAKMIDYNS